MASKLFERGRCMAVLTALAASLAAGCDHHPAAKPAPTDASTAPATRTWKAPEARDLTHPEKAANKWTKRTLDLTPPQRFPDCHELFEPHGQVAKAFPLHDDGMRALALAGCGVEAYRTLDDGTHYVAYATPAKGAGWDLRLAAYDPTGKLAWSYKLDRSQNADNFTANFRGSFIVPLLPRLVCAGTLWEGGTQAACVDPKTGKARWDGMMPFWSGIAPQGHDVSLVAATISGLSQRYPYSGVEMRYEPFGDSGGRTAFYATDANHLFYVPGDGGAIHMTAFNLDSFAPSWRLDLPARPKAPWKHAFARFGIVLFEIDTTVYAADADTGKVLWAVEVGDDQPPVAAAGKQLFLLLHRQTDPNLLYALDARTGQIHWYSTVPTGTLELFSYDDTLVLKSVRAVQKVNNRE